MCEKPNGVRVSVTSTIPGCSLKQCGLSDLPERYMAVFGFNLPLCLLRLVSQVSYKHSKYLSVAKDDIREAISFISTSYVTLNIWY